MTETPAGLAITEMVHLAWSEYKHTLRDEIDADVERERAFNRPVDPSAAHKARTADFRALLEKIAPDVRRRGIPEYEPPDHGDTSVSPVRLPPV